MTAKKRPDYFGLDVGRLLGSGKPAAKDGTYKASALGLDYGGKGYRVRADGIMVTLKGNRSRGTFKATTLEGRPSRMAAGPTRGDRAGIRDPD